MNDRVQRHQAALGPLPQSWSGLSWQQLCCCWRVKIRYGGNADVARAAALLGLTGMEVCGRGDISETTGEAVYLLRGVDGMRFKVTPRELSQMAGAALPWFDYPYGDPGDKEERDDKGNIVRERRDAVPGYVSPMRDAMVLPRETVKISGRLFALPQPACSNLTWQQYRSLQGIVPQMFQDGISPDSVSGLRAQFLANCLVPRSLALLDTSGGSIRLCPHWEYTYNMGHADRLVSWWMKRLTSGSDRDVSAELLFHICLQVYQTSMAYYASAYPLLFDGGGSHDPMRDALQGEVGTVNTIMKYAGYAEQQQVYDSYLPFVLDILNTMSKEAKQIEAMNAKIRRK